MFCILLIPKFFRCVTTAKACHVETIEPHIGDDHQYPNRTIDKITFQNWINFAGLYNANYGVRFRNRKTRTCAGAIGSNAY